MDTTPAVSVIVPVRDGASTLGACLDGLAAQVGVDYEVIVVDNGSSDATYDVAQRHPVGPQVLRESQRGSYAARNAGLAVATAPVLAFTDADCVPAPEWLAAGLRAIAAGADLVGGAIRMPPSADPTLAERYDRAVNLRQRDLVETQGWAVTANLFVRRSTVAAAGPFDAGLPSGGDREFCLRAGRAGALLRYADDAVVEHEPRTSLRGLWRLHRRIGAGIAALASRGQAPAPWRDRDLRQPLGWVWESVAETGPPVRRRRLAPVHALAMTARWVGRITGR